MKFQDVIDLKRWQQIQDIASSIVTMSLKAVDVRGNDLSAASHLPDIYREIVFRSEKAQSEYNHWVKKRLAELVKYDQSHAFQAFCPVGLAMFFLPMQAEKIDLSYLLVGPLVLENCQRETHMSRRIKELDLHEEQFFAAYNKLPAVNVQAMNNILEFLNTIVQFVFRVSQLVRQQKQPAAILNKENVGGLLKTLLEMAMKLCNAEFGSVMTFEKQSQMLSIQQAEGLSDEVVNSTKLKPGEGLAGLTIQRRQALFVNDQLKDREIRLRMHRPKVKSAFVIPVFHQQEVLGVISVGTAKSPNRFSDNLMELLNVLVSLALDQVTFESKDS
ncbi:MAG: PocR ligand-binding domain-containing protein [Candidatus Omnitrophica bacterium]|nr:PocR ligand-binding domain-containing protein [Candidatus Omnitrophota bacterium]